jgi:hypothetical protein
VSSLGVALRSTSRCTEWRLRSPERLPRSSSPGYPRTAANFRKWPDLSRPAGASKVCLAWEGVPLGRGQIASRGCPSVGLLGGVGLLKRRRRCRRTRRVGRRLTRNHLRSMPIRAGHRYPLLRVRSRECACPQPQWAMRECRERAYAGWRACSCRWRHRCRHMSRDHFAAGWRRILDGHRVHRSPCFGMLRRGLYPRRR